MDFGFDISDITKIKGDNVLPEPGEYTYWKAREDRVFYVDYEIDETYELMELCKSIIQLNMEDRFVPKEELKPIYIFVYSYGGDLEQTYGAIGVIESSRIPIITVNMGVAMSAGFLLLLSGHKRYSFKYTNSMVHQGRAGFTGTPSEIETAQKNYQRQLSQMKNYVLSKTTIPEKMFDKKKSIDWYLSDQQQLEYGVVDEVIEDFDTLFYLDDLDEIRLRNRNRSKVNGSKKNNGGKHTGGNRHSGNRNNNNHSKDSVKENKGDKDESHLAKAIRESNDKRGVVSEN